jgi:hypothetical protein
MRYIRTLVDITDYDKVKEVVSDLNTYNDLILLSGESNEDGPIDVNYLCRNGDVVKIGELPQKIVNEIRTSFGKDVWIEVSDFGVYKKEDGTYRLWVGLETDDEVKSKNGGNGILSTLLCISAIACAVTAVAVSIALIIKYREKNQ